MSDLISRKKIRDYIKGEINPYGKPFEGTAYELGLKIIRYIDAMDSVYDIDKVVEELEERKEEREKQYKRASMEDGSYMLSKCFREGSRAYGNAIEIVKQGSISDDVCEWKYNNSEYYWESSCEHLHIFMSDGPEENEYKFCPYCGKKIKVV